tara:strand:+ start:9474 stop:10295 length:822 start_codon:yes stop_codon:yes gene_type:complete
MSLRNIENLTLLGFGRMGRAMAKGWIENGLSKNHLRIIDPNISEQDDFIMKNKLKIYHPEDLSFDNNLIVIAVKPQVSSEVLENISSRINSTNTLVSIVAGYSIADIRKCIGSDPNVIRAMPNTPASVGMAMSVLCCDSYLPNMIKDSVTQLFTSIGSCRWITDESYMHLVTAISGSGPAYYFLLTEYLSKIAREKGLDEEFANELVTRTFIGSAALIEEYKDISITAQRENVTSPGGTTEAALKLLMENDKLLTILNNAIDSAILRSQKLSK